jgi:beta-glucosidase
MTTTTSRFLWGAGTAAHQNEGGNVNNNVWEWEHADRTAFREPSGDASDSYHRWPEDLDSLVAMGLGTYRFSIEWSRVEPEKGQFSLAALAHYRRILDGCAERGLTAVVTLLHFTIPRWLWRDGGFTHPQVVARFTQFAEKVVTILGPEVAYVTTINEPNMTNMLYTRMTQGFAAADEARLDSRLTDTLIACHRSAAVVLRESGAGVGWSTAVHNFVVDDDAGEAARQLVRDGQNRFLEVSREDDYVGIQTYTRTPLGDAGTRPAPDHVRKTQMGWEFYPDALRDAIRLAHDIAPETPILVTENGLATTDDTERVEYIDAAVAGMKTAQDEGATVLGYLHWSALDNFEWLAGYEPKFGLVAVDRQTFRRTIKPSGYHLGRLAAQSAAEGA